MGKMNNKELQKVCYGKITKANVILLLTNQIVFETKL